MRLSSRNPKKDSSEQKGLPVKSIVSVLRNLVEVNEHEEAIDCSRRCVVLFCRPTL
jgi:hypothetical protein